MHPLTALRDERNLTQQRVADMAEVNRASVVRIEHGVRTAGYGRALRKIARALCVSPDAIVEPGQVTGRAPMQEVVAEFFGLDPLDPRTRAHLAELKEAHAHADAA